MATNLDFLDTPLLREAHRFAREAHHGEGRRGDTHIDHPDEVARLVHDAGYPEEVVAGALLHDVLEDTDTSADELRQRFGTGVTDLVASLTENAAISIYERRKAALRGQVVEAGPGASAIFAADKLAKARALNRAGKTPDPPRLAHYAATLRLLRERRPDTPFLDELGEELERLGATGAATERARRLRDGRTVFIRQIDPLDADRLGRAYERLSPESRRLRFVSTPPRLSEEDLRYLTDVDGTRHDALVALDPETGDLVGEARYVREPGSTETAEVAAVVVDEWQGKGLATALLTALTHRARERGLRRYKAIVAVDNQVVLEALAKLGAKPIGGADGQVELELDVPAEDLSERLLGALRWAAQGQLRLVGRVAGRMARLVSA
jgi:RimJ/RimL family protein N-acetyltransferase